MNWHCLLSRGHGGQADLGVEKSFSEGELIGTLAAQLIIGEYTEERPGKANKFISPH